MHTTYTLDDALTLREIAEVGQSWHHASAKNDDALMALQKERDRGRP